ncbi:glycerol-3-phosphate 1-O-acyltransferase PlsY [Solimonas terrae]|uniref:Glycerol-3-phosphate acyltransferase n=1 Tax=Solimonas terrae TaxID=1396819 RepID=A0A6M2BSB8_9GAMM|nr:glycerol-3-phosphate 1-O-acyltransferase PlsY [Solimonas terrae]NGY05496.1 glycerol-3-phosphate 1-O-acyltransferase PlsY [Solimonas terrae]
MIDLIVKTLLAYLLGNLMGGQLMGCLRGGIDLRTVGSGNVGATNALRTQGKGFALGVLAIDVLKGVIAALLLPRLPSLGTLLVTAQEQAYACGVAVVLGHCYPAFAGFRGGKGVATLAGVFATLLGAALLWMLLAFVLVILLSGYVSLATLTAAATAIAWLAICEPQQLFAATGLFVLAMAVLVTWKHRENIVRLARGEEHRFEKARVLGRWLQR